MPTVRGSEIAPQHNKSRLLCSVKERPFAERKAIVSANLLAQFPTGEIVSPLSEGQTMTQSLILVFVLGAFAGRELSAQAQDGPALSLEESRAEYQAATKAYLGFLEGREAMKRKLRDMKVASDDEVDFWRFQVAVSRGNLAQLQGDAAGSREQLRIAVAIREG